MTADQAASVLVADARNLAKTLLCKDLAQRWLHTQGVASRAAELAATVTPDDRHVLIAAAWLHDIGYAPQIQETGFHQLDGALFLRRHGWDDRLAALVAHHSGARLVLAEPGIEPMMSEFDVEFSPVSDALTWAEHTIGRYGRRKSMTNRIAESLVRDNVNPLGDRDPFHRIASLLVVGDRVEQRLKQR